MEAYLDVFGHEEIRSRLSRAITAGRLPHSLLLHGPRGVGKQRLALWSAAALNCRGEAAPPCGSCHACRLSGRLEHPDIHWFFPMPRPKGASSPDKLESKLEDKRAEELESRRSDPLYLEESEGAAGIYVAAVTTMRKLAQKAPAMGPAKVFVIGHAESLIPQTGAAEAANALLKLLEEPPDDTTLILTSDVPGALLPTIRSRVQSIRVGPLPLDRVAEFLAEHTDLSTAEAGRLAATSAGSIGRALELKDEDRETVRKAALDLVRALLDGRPVAHFAAAHSHRAFGARGTFAHVLKEVGGILRDLMAESAGAGSAVMDADTVGPLTQRYRPTPQRLIRALGALDEARGLADRNVNPQLIVIELLRAGSDGSERV